MARKVSAAPKSVQSFADYFDSSADMTTILQGLGYGAAIARIVLPRYSGSGLEFTNDLEKSLIEAMPYISLTSEAARREFLIAPLLREIAVRFQIKVNVEYAMNISPTLRGKIDYLLDSETGDFVLIEAKLGDMYGGMKQLSAELVALDQWADGQATHLYGAVSIGVAWQFAVLDRAAKIVTQDVALFKIPGDLEDLTRVIVGILRGTGDEIAPAQGGQGV